MPCIQCGAENTIKAHLIPEAFVMEVKTDRGEQHLILHERLVRPDRSNTGKYDPDILCAECDNLLGNYEGYAHRLLKRLRQNRAPTNATIVPIDQIDGDKMVRFAAGIAWKYAMTRPEWGRISIGPYPAILGEIAFKGEPIPPSVDVTMIRIVEMDGDAYYYRTPIPDRQEGINFVRFCVGGFVFFLKIDRRPSGGFFPPECWLRGRCEGKYWAVPAEWFEEGQRHANLANRPQVRQFFQRMNESSNRSKSGHS